MHIARQSGTSLVRTTGSTGRSGWFERRVAGVRLFSVALAVLVSVLQILALVPSLLITPSNAQAAPVNPESAATAVVITAGPTPDASETYAFRVFEWLGLATTTVTADDLTASDVPVPSAGAPVLWFATEQAAARLSPGQINLLRSRVEAGAAGFLAQLSSAASPLTALTGPSVLGASPLPPSTPPVSQFTSGFPAYSRELTGVTFGHALPRPGSAVNYQPGPGITPIIVGTGAASGQARLLAVTLQQGTLFVQAETPNPAVLTGLFRGLFWAQHENGQLFSEHLLEAMPLVLFAKWAAGDAAWHGTRRLANVTIDDPPLVEPFWDMDWTADFYEQILAHAQAHNYHVTIATIPTHLPFRSSHVVSLFRDNPDRLSLQPHGYFHDCPDFPPSLTDQQDLKAYLDVRTMMDQFSAAEGVPYSPVMLWPCNDYWMRDLVAIKRWNYLASSNGSDPWDAPAITDWTFQANHVGRFPGGAPLVWRNFGWTSGYPVDFALDRPVLLFYHPADFEQGYGTFDPWADQINALGPVTWSNLGDIFRRHVWQKRNADGSYGAQLFFPDAIIENTGTAARTYHVEYADDGTTPIDQVTVDGQPVAYTLADGAIRLTITVPAGGERRVSIRYVEPDPSEYNGTSTTSTPTPTPPPGGSVNLIANSDFETNLNGWSSWQGNLSRVQDGHSGNFAVRVSALPGATAFTLDNWPGEAPNPPQGATYAASAWIRGDAGTIGKRAWLVIREHDESTADEAYSAPVTLTAEWQQLTVQKTIANAGMTNADVYVLVIDTQTGDAVYVDDVLMWQGTLNNPPSTPTASATASPTPPASGTDTPTPTMTPTATGTVTPTPTTDTTSTVTATPTASATPTITPTVSATATPPGVTNLIANPGFETNLTGWSSWQGTISRVAGGHSGGFSARVTADPGATIYTIDNWPGAAPNPAVGDQFAATAWVRGEGATIGKQAWLILRAHNADLSQEQAAFSQPITLSDSWQPLAVELTVSLGGLTNVDVLIQVAGVTGGAVFYADDFVMWRGSLTATPVPTSTPTSTTVPATATPTTTGTPTPTVIPPTATTTATATAIPPTATATPTATPTTTAPPTATATATATPTATAVPPTTTATATATAPTGAVNLIANPGFETNTNGWAGWQATVSRVAGGHSGGFAASVESTAGATTFTIDNWPGADPNPPLGQTYAATVWVKGTSSTIGKQAWLVIRAHNADASVEDYAYSAPVVLTADWQQIGVQHTIATAGMTNVDIFVQVAGTSGTSTFLADDFAFWRGTLDAPPPT